MSKKIMLLALAAASVAAFALPTMAMAEDIPLHLVPKPEGAKAITGGAAELSTVGGTKVTSKKTDGTATYETSTTGTVELTFTESSSFGFPCTSPGQTSGTVTTASQPFHLVTLAEEKPGILITPPANGIFAEFTCAGFLTAVVKGNGIIGTITEPACGASSTTSTSSFEKSATGVQKHKFVAGTETEYHLTSSINGGAFEQAAQVGAGITNLVESAKLECT